MTDPTVNSPETLKDEIATRQLNEQQQSWELDSRGRATFESFPTISEGREAQWIQPDHYMTQFLSGHGNLCSKIRRFGLVEADKCRCGSVDTPYTYTFYECNRFETLRKEHRRKIRSMGLNWPPGPKQSTTEEATKEIATFAAQVLKDKKVWDHETRDQNDKISK